MTKKLYIKTHGCQMNEYDSAKINEIMQSEKDFILVNKESEADLLVLNLSLIHI